MHAFVVLLGLVVGPTSLAACRGVLGIETDREIEEADASGPGAERGAFAPSPAPTTDADSWDGGEHGREGGTSVTGSLDWANWPIAPPAPPASQFVVGPDTVLDKVTGLAWQRGQSDPLIWALASEYCKTVKAGGASDWRMPTWIELVSVVDYTRLGPALPEAFDAGVGHIFWSSTRWLNEDNAPARVGVSLYNASVGPMVFTSEWPVRCVRGATHVHDPAQGAPKGRYVLTAGTARDTKTALIWQRGGAPTQLAHTDAVGYCTSLSVDHLTGGWRLPTIRELFTILDPDAPDAPRWDRPTFGSTAPMYLWSSTSDVLDPSSAFRISVEFLQGGRGPASELGGARCVHD